VGVKDRDFLGPSLLRTEPVFRGITLFVVPPDFGDLPRVKSPEGHRFFWQGSFRKRYSESFTGSAVCHFGWVEVGGLRKLGTPALAQVRDCKREEPYQGPYQVSSPKS